MPRYAFVAVLVAAVALIAYLAWDARAREKRIDATIREMTAAIDPKHVGDVPIFASSGTEVWAYTSSKRGQRTMYITKAGQAAGVVCVVE